MSKRLDCIVEGCHATVEAETEEELMAQVEGHAAEHHPDVELDEETVSTIRASIEDV